jgi:hypothetical protein
LEKREADEMNMETTRFCVVSNLDHRQLAQVHRQEIEAGYCFPSGLLATMFRVSIGEIVESSGREVERAVTALADTVRRRYRAEHTGCCFPPFDGRSDANCPAKAEVALQHRLDLALLDKNVQVPTQSTKRIRDMIGTTVV